MGLPQARALLRLLSCYAPVVPIPLALVQAVRLDSFPANVLRAALALGVYRLDDTRLDADSRATHLRKQRQ